MFDDLIKRTTSTTTTSIDNNRSNLISKSRPEVQQQIFGIKTNKKGNNIIWSSYKTLRDQIVADNNDDKEEGETFKLLFVNTNVCLRKI